MLTDRSTEIYLMSLPVVDLQRIHQLDIKPFECEVTKKCMAHLCTFKHLNILTIDFQFHLHRLILVQRYEKKGIVGSSNLIFCCPNVIKSDDRRFYFFSLSRT